MNHSIDPLAGVDFQRVRVLVVGDVMLDRFRYGSVRRISPEGPVPVIRAESDTLMLGGAGNVTANLAALGCTTGLIAVVGDDRAGQDCRAMVAATGADPDLLVSAPGRCTTIKTRFISGSQQLLRCDEEDLTDLDSAVEDAILAHFDACLAQFDVVALSDYAKGVLTDRVLAQVIARCAEARVPVIVDPKRKDMRAYAGATLIKPNRAELADATGLACRNFDECARAAAVLIEQTGSDLLVTMSEEGMALFCQGAEPQRFGATAAEVFDVSGAGDTALASLCAMLGAGMDLPAAVRVANAAAGAVVRKLGTATLTREELALALDAEDPYLHIGLCSLQQAVRQVTRWKREGLRVGFTNGCFDIVHAGHIAILREARARCDRLVVGLNSDASVARLKGAERPIQPEHSRAAVLAAIDAVDLVVVFEDDTPLRLIEELRPTDLVKGADYTEDRVVGADVVRADGGRVHLVDLVPGLSTTRAVERIRAGERTGERTGERARA